jgi:hypothetical protein
MLSRRSLLKSATALALAPLAAKVASAADTESATPSRWAIGQVRIDDRSVVTMRWAPVDGAVKYRVFHRCCGQEQSLVTNDTEIQIDLPKGANSFVKVDAIFPDGDRGITGAVGLDF